nr:TPA_asm: hypothetical protein [Corynactis coral adintovirus]
MHALKKLLSDRCCGSSAYYDSAPAHITSWVFCVGTPKRWIWGVAFSGRKTGSLILYQTWQRIWNGVRAHFSGLDSEYFVLVPPGADFPNVGFEVGVFQDWIRHFVLGVTPQLDRLRDTWDGSKCCMPPSRGVLIYVDYLSTYLLPGCVLKNVEYIYKRYVL